MEFLHAKDMSEGKIASSTRSTWEADSAVKRSLKRRAVALLLDFENNRDLLQRKVIYWFNFLRVNLTFSSLTNL